MNLEAVIDGSPALTFTSDGITVLHLSDIHAGMASQGWLWPGLKHRLFDDLKRTIAMCGPWDVVVFSGDLTQKGTESEYAKLDEIIAELWFEFKKLGASPKLFPVPGNHDLVRPPIQDPANKLLHTWQSDSQIREAFWNNSPTQYRECIEKAFENYSTWLSRLKERAMLPDSFTDGLLPGDCSAVLNVRDHTLGLIGLNSAWLHLQEGDYKGRLELDPRQLLAVTDQDPDAWCSRNSTNLIITHHPSDWLSPTGVGAWRGDIFGRNRFDAHLFGHMHQPNSLSTSEGGFPTKRTVQAASLFGLESHHDQRSRIHGYSSLRFSITGGARSLRQWPRKAIPGMDGVLKLEPNIEFDLVDHAYFDYSYSQLSGTQTPEMVSAASTQMHVSTQRSSDLLNSIRQMSVPSNSALAVRQVEQEIGAAALRDLRSVWIVADWGLGSDEFIRSLMTGKTNLLYRIDCAPYLTREEFLAGVQSQLGQSFEQLCDLISLQPPCVLVLDDINIGTGLDDSTRTFQNEVDLIVEVILEYCDNVEVIVQSRRNPQNTAITRVRLQPLDEADTRAYVAAHSLGGKVLANSPVAFQIFSHTDGVPAGIDAALRDIQIVGTSQIHSLNPDIAGKAALHSGSPPGLAAAVEALKSPASVAGAFGLLKALAMYSRGEQLSTLRRFNQASAFYPADARRLVEQELVDTIELPNLDGAQMDAGRALVVKRPVRDYLYATLPAKELRKLSSRALQIYFGDDWSTGVIRPPKTMRFDHSSCGGWQITNASTLVLRALNEAIESQQSARIRQVYILALAYSQALDGGDHYRGIVTLWSEVLPLVEALEEGVVDLRDARLEYAKALRMSGFRDRAIPLFVELRAGKSSNAKKQAILLNLALSYEVSGDTTNAYESAKACIKIAPRNNHALHAQAVLLRTDPQSKVDLKSELIKLEGVARKKGADVVANHLAITRALNAPPEEAKPILHAIANGADGKNDEYNSMQAAVKLAKLTLDQGEAVTGAELDRLIHAYHYLYGENFSSWFNDCHGVLWRIFEQLNGTDNLMRLFRHSSLIWRIRDNSKIESSYIGKLQGLLGDVADADILTASRELSYFKTRVSRFSSSKALSNHSNI